MTAPIKPPTPEAIRHAAELLSGGGLVAMPTETVYGLAADAGNAQAVARLYAAKGRPAFNPLIAHIATFDQARALGQFSPAAERLAAAHWPGPLTLVVPATADGHVCDLARAGLDSVALRMPAHPVARALLTAFDGPLVAPSANPSGQISPTRPEHVATDMGDKVDLILDGGPCASGIESTIIDARGPAPVLLRPGGVPAAEIEAIWPGLIRSGDDETAPRSPGQLARHYAPGQPLRLNASAPRAGENYLGFGPTGAGPAPTLNLSASGDLVEAAANLFDMLRQLDQLERPIAAAPIPNNGLGEAINDRLTRAAKQD